jgi:hypothetical protein
MARFFFVCGKPKPIHRAPACLRDQNSFHQQEANQAQEVCGKLALSYVDNSDFLLRKNLPVGKHYFNPQVKRRYPEPSSPLEHRVMNPCRVHEYWATPSYPHVDSRLRINIKTKLL